MYSCTMPVPDPSPPPKKKKKKKEREAANVLNKNFDSRIICTVMVWWSFGCVLGCFGCFNGPHDGYANGSKAQTSLSRAIGSPTYSKTVLLRAVG